jgi:hypothetical protein
MGARGPDRDRRRQARKALGRSVLGAVCLAACLAPTALAAPPPNDNYLASYSMLGAGGGGVATGFHDAQDTTEAGVQADLLNPDRDGLPLGGGPAETTSCAGTGVGKTVWYDFAPPYSGGAQITTSGFPTVVAVYEYDIRTARIVRQVACQGPGPTGVNELLVLTPAVKGHAYTVQVGGAVAGGEPASGRLDFTFHYYRDGDGDGVLDAEPDVCPLLAGIAPTGCPPRLAAVPRYAWVPAPGGIRLRTLVVSGLPGGSRVEARCRRCGLRQVVKVAAGAHQARLSRLTGPTLRAGSTLELRVTHPQTAAGDFRHGAIGGYFRFAVRANGLGDRVDRCLMPGSTTPRRTCR